MAFNRSFFPTISTMNAWRAGMSKALAAPNSSASTMTCHTSTSPVSVRPARMSANAIIEVWARTTTRWRLYRSATAPPKGARTNTGIWLANPTTPSNSAESVRR